MKDKCAHPQCEEKNDVHRLVYLPTRWGYEAKWYCKKHKEYGSHLAKYLLYELLDIQERLGGDSKRLEQWDLFGGNDKTIPVNRDALRIVGNQLARTLPKRRTLVYERDGNKCLACGTTENLTLDHIIPLSKNGGNGMDNLQTLCKKCNGEKGSRIRDYRVPESIELL